MYSHVMNRKQFFLTILAAFVSRKLPITLSVVAKPHVLDQISVITRQYIEANGSVLFDSFFQDTPLTQLYELDKYETSMIRRMTNVYEMPIDDHSQYLAVPIVYHDHKEHT